MQVTYSPFALPQTVQKSPNNTFTVRWINFQEFQKDLTPTFHHFDERLQHFASLFTPIPHSRKQIVDYYQLWVNVGLADGSDADLELQLTQGNYESNAIAKSAIEERSNSSFYFLKIFDESTDETPLLSLRFNPSGTVGEIVYIQKGTQFSGSQIKEISMQILQFLKIDRVYLNDDAKFTVSYPSDEENKGHTITIPMRTYLPVVTDEGETWYGKSGFSPFDCHELRSFERGVKVSQNRESYYRSVMTVREISLAVLYREVLSQPSKFTLISLCARYLPGINLKNIDRNIKRLANVALHDLAKNLYAATLRKDPHALNDFIAFNQSILACDEMSSHSYHQALDTIYYTCLWQRCYADPNENSSYLQYRKAI
jgi:hypothetical protein